MIDVSKLPFPTDAPPPGTCVRIERPEPGLAVLVLDPPHRSLAVLDAPMIRDLDAAVTALEGDATLQGIVITGRAPDQFAAGADVKAIAQLTEPAQVDALVRAVHGLFDRIETLRPFTVAAVGGPVPGGAFELSLACDRIVATDDPKTRIGLPETQLGIIPGWGGSHRLPRRIGVPRALQAILTGKLHPAKQALKLGLIDRLTQPEYLQRVAADIAMKRVRIARARRGTFGAILDRLAAPWIAAQARKQVMAKTQGHYPAPLAAIDLVTRAPATPPSHFAEREAAAVAELATGPVCKSLIAVFLGMEEQKRLGRVPDAGAVRSIARVGVLGAGVMGGGIASLCAQKGLSARLGDLSPDALDKAQLTHRADVEKSLRRRRLQRHEAMAAIDRLEVTERLIGFARCDLVIEAVAERLDVKRTVLREMAAQVSEDAILATNTSSLSVDAIAEGVPRPERVCGMHFFNPVAKMPLVEVVRGTQTSDATVAAVAALALRLGKTPIVCRDVAGFLVNRILGPYLDEAVRLFEEGADIARVDRLMLAFGMPMGPFRLLDEVGIDIARHAAASLHAAYGERMTPSTGLDGFASSARLGRKTGLGFYRHPRDGEPTPAADLPRPSGATRQHDDAEIVDRLVLSMVNEAARCLEQDVVASARELDLATVLGTGFAPFRGGLLRDADARGLRVVVARLEALATLPVVAARPGGKAKFTPTALLAELAVSGERFHGVRKGVPVSFAG